MEGLMNTDGVNGDDTFKRSVSHSAAEVVWQRMSGAMKDE